MRRKIKFRNMFPMSTRRAFSGVGIHVYGFGAIALGLVGLVWRDFASVWQPVPATTPHRTALAYIATVLLLAGGAAVQWRRIAQAGIVVLAILYFIFALLWLPRVFGYPQIFATWGGFFEQLSLVAAGLVAYASLAPSHSAWPVITARIGRFFYGICVLSFALNHFFALKETARMVPAWVAPGQQFWAVATGVFHLLAGMAILSGVLPVLASWLLTAMLGTFGALVWAPSLFGAPHEHMVWAGNAINLALTGGAWVIADAMVSRREQIHGQQDANGSRHTSSPGRPRDVTV